MIHLDTSTLIDALTGPKPSAPRLRAAIENGERILLSVLVLYEWLRGPRLEQELAIQEALFPRESAIPFGVEEALGASELYRRVRNPRGREVDLAIAASAMTHQAALWTLSPADFRDIPGLELYVAG